MTLRLVHYDFQQCIMLHIALGNNVATGYKLFRKFLHDLEAQRAGCSIPNAVRVLLALRTSKSCGPFNAHSIYIIVHCLPTALKKLYALIIETCLLLAHSKGVYMQVHRLPLDLEKWKERMCGC